jgi:cell division protease FtsH
VNPKYRTLLVWVVLLAVLFALYSALHEPDVVERQPVATFAADVEHGDVVSVQADEQGWIVTTRQGEYRTAYDETTGDLVSRLEGDGVPISYESSRSDTSHLVLTIVPIVVLLAALAYFVRNRQNQQKATMSTAFDLKKSRARLVPAGSEKLTFADVGGLEDAKARLGDVVDFLKNPKRWTDAGVRLPRGVLLEGPPGTGKTLLARAMAGEAGVPFFIVSASEFVELFVGVGAARVRDLFETAAKAAPAVVFIDELDAVGRRRGSGIGTGHDEREQTLNQLLVCIDGFERNHRLVVVAATNRADVLDKALLRPGRFDVRITLPPLDAAGRARALAIHTRDKKLDVELSLDAIAALTEGFTGATLEQLANEAALVAVRRREGGPAITMADVRVALASIVPKADFDALDALLLESASQLARPVAKAHVRVTLDEGEVVEGTIQWADATFLKIDGRIVAKARVREIRALEGTEAAAEVSPDRWASHRPELA